LKKVQFVVYMYTHENNRNNGCPLKALTSHKISNNFYISGNSVVNVIIT